MKYKKNSTTEILAKTKTNKLRMGGFAQVDFCALDTLRFEYKNRKQQTNKPNHTNKNPTQNSQKNTNT